MSTPTDIEKTNLEAHVELCAQRYDALERRLTSVEEKIISLQKTVSESSLNTTKVLIGSAVSIIVAILGLIGVIVTKTGIV